jgi:hypothetical protein
MQARKLKVRESVGSGCWPDFLRSALRAAGRNEVRECRVDGDPGGLRITLLATDLPCHSRPFAKPSFLLPRSRPSVIFIGWELEEHPSRRLRGSSRLRSREGSLVVLTSRLSGGASVPQKPLAARKPGTTSRVIGPANMEAEYAEREGNMGSCGDSNKDR